MVPRLMRTKATSSHIRIIQAVLFFAANGLGTGGCIGARLGQGVAKLDPAVEITFALLFGGRLAIRSPSVRMSLRE